MAGQPGRPPPRPQSKSWLSTEEAAQQIGMSRRFVRDRIEAGDLPARAWRSGQRVIYRISGPDLDAFVLRFSGEPLDPGWDRPTDRADDAPSRRPEGHGRSTR